MAEGWGGLTPPETPIIREPTHEAVRQYSEQIGCGIDEAARVLTKAALIDATQRASTVDELKQIVMRLVSLIPS